MTDLISLSIPAALTGLKAKTFSATELTNAHLTQMEKMRHLNAYVTEAADYARAQALEADKRYASNTARGLEGIVLLADLLQELVIQALKKLLFKVKPFLR